MRLLWVLSMCYRVPCNTCARHFYSAGLQCLASSPGSCSGSISRCMLGTYCPQGTRNRYLSMSQIMCREGYSCPTPATREICPPGYACPHGTVDGGQRCPTDLDPAGVSVELPAFERLCLLPDPPHRLGLGDPGLPGCLECAAGRAVAAGRGVKGGPAPGCCAVAEACATRRRRRRGFHQLHGLRIGPDQGWGWGWGWGVGA